MQQKYRLLQPNLNATTVNVIRISTVVRTRPSRSFKSPRAFSAPPSPMLPFRRARMIQLQKIIIMTTILKQHSRNPHSRNSCTHYVRFVRGPPGSNLINNIIINITRMCTPCARQLLRVRKNNTRAYSVEEKKLRFPLAIHVIWWRGIYIFIFLRYV